VNISREPAWQRSTRRGTSSCVEVAEVDTSHIVRDFKNPHAAPLASNRDVSQLCISPTLR
jgi:hypothetical protein